MSDYGDPERMLRVLADLPVRRRPRDPVVPNERVRAKAAEIRRRRGMAPLDPAVEESMTRLYDEHSALEDGDL